MQPKNIVQKNIGIALGVIVIAAVSAVTIFSNKKDTPTTKPDDTTNSSTTLPPADTKGTTAQIPPVDTTKNTAASVYTNGTYTAVGSYMSPGGLDHIGVTLTLKNDIITTVSIDPQPGDHTSSRYMTIFASGYEQYVVGKNIADVHLTHVSGSSLTPEGFNDALAQIKTQSKA
jgi:hypothetical protein